MRFENIDISYYDAIIFGGALNINFDLICPNNETIELKNSFLYYGLNQINFSRLIL